MFLGCGWGVLTHNGIVQCLCTAEASFELSYFSVEGFKLPNIIGLLISMLVDLK